MARKSTPAINFFCGVSILALAGTGCLELQTAQAGQANKQTVSAKAFKARGLRARKLNARGSLRGNSRRSMTRRTLQPKTLSRKKVKLKTASPSGPTIGSTGLRGSLSGDSRLKKLTAGNKRMNGSGVTKKSRIQRRLSKKTTGAKSAGTIRPLHDRVPVRRQNETAAKAVATKSRLMKTTPTIMPVAGKDGARQDRNAHHPRLPVNPDGSVAIYYNYKPGTAKNRGASEETKAAIAIPAHQDHTIRSKVTESLASGRSPGRVLPKYTNRSNGNTAGVVAEDVEGEALATLIVDMPRDGQKAGIGATIALGNEIRATLNEDKREVSRQTPFFSNYRPQFYFRTTDVTGTPGSDTVWSGKLRGRVLNNTDPSATGTVNWFNTSKGYGFIAPEDSNSATPQVFQSYALYPHMSMALVHSPKLLILDEPTSVAIKNNMWASIVDMRDNDGRAGITPMDADAQSRSYFGLNQLRDGGSGNSQTYAVDMFMKVRDIRGESK